MIPTFTAAPGLAQLRALADESLPEHHEMRAAKDEPAAIAALGDALAAVRQMTRHTRLHPELWQSAMDVVNLVMAAAEAAQGKVYGIYERRYRRVRIMAVGLQITIADRTSLERGRAERQSKHAAPAIAAPVTTPPSPPAPRPQSGAIAPPAPTPPAAPPSVANRPATPFNQAPRPGNSYAAPPHNPGPRRVWM